MTECGPVARDEAAAGVSLAEGPPRHSVYLHPGQLIVSERPEVVLTILGSCVAVCLWDIRRPIGGVSHFVLPHRTSEGTTRVAGVAVPRLVEQLLGLGASPRDLRAKLVGGANVVCPRVGTAPTFGEKNASIARELLREGGVPIVAEHLGGQRGRRLVFETASGAAWVRRLQLAC
jgi:chemotaxis protein CheD